MPYQGQFELNGVLACDSVVILDPFLFHESGYATELYHEGLLIFMVCTKARTRAHV